MQFTLDIGQEKKNAMFYSRTHLDHSKLYNHVSVKKKNRTSIHKTLTSTDVLPRKPKS